MKYRSLAGSAIGAALAIGTPATGQVRSTETSFGAQTGTLDFRQGLEFLDVPLTFSSSMPEILVEMEPGGAFEGWRYATPAEVNGLFISAHVAPVVAVYQHHAADGFSPELFDLQQLVGFWESPSGQRFSQAWTSETRNTGAFLEARLGLIQIETDSWQFGTAFWQRSDMPLAVVGSWLVRDRPGCRADVALPLGELNFFDVAQFITRYGAGDPSADIAEPIGVLNFFDIAEYVALYNTGC